MLESSMDDFEAMYSQMKETLIKDVACTTFKSQRRNLLDAFFGNLESKAAQV